MKKYIFFFLIVCIIICKDSNAQDVISSEYLIITYEIDRTKDAHKPIKYSWITPIDSMSKRFPLYLLGFSKTHLNSCCQRDATNIFTTTTATNFDFDAKYENQINQLSNMIDNHGKLIQKIVKKWSAGYKEVIKIYITPVSGKFCACKIDPSDGNKIDYYGLIYLPFDDIKINGKFWKSEKSKSPLLNDLYKAQIKTSRY